LAQKQNKKDKERLLQFQDSNKRKGTESKTLGYVPRVLFFNAFELGAVILENAHIGARKKLKAKVP
jgi:hypothetical protein